MSLNPEIMIMLLAVAYLAMLIIEAAASFVMKKGYYSAEFLWVNTALSYLQQVSGLAYQVIFLGGYTFVQTHFSIQHFLPIDELASGWPITISTAFPFVQLHVPVLMNWLLVLVLADFCQYWLHRLSHEVNILWAGHIVHHSNEEYNYGVAIRQSFIEGFYTWIFYLPLALAGIPWELFISAYSLSLLWQFFVHTQFVQKMGILEKFMATPSHHRAHHGKNDIYLDKNYGALFIIWDKLFGTFQEESEKVQFGITVPFKSVNLLKINIHHHLYIFNLMKKAKTFKEKIKIFFGLPSYLPAGIKPTYGHEAEFAFTPQSSKKWYVFLSFIVAAPAGLLWMNHYRISPDIVSYILLTIVLMVQLVTLSGLLEDKLWANVLEITKLCIMLGVGWLMIISGFSFLTGVFLVVFSGISLLATYFMAENYKRFSLSSSSKV